MKQNCLQYIPTKQIITEPLQSDHINNLFFFQIKLKTIIIHLFIMLVFVCSNHEIISQKQRPWDPFLFPIKILQHYILYFQLQNTPLKQSCYNPLIGLYTPAGQSQPQSPGQQQWFSKYIDPFFTIFRNMLITFGGQSVVFMQPQYVQNVEAQHQN
eukprot:TRINITY_DN72349_c0_g1_i1.p1 TRINITY_DN72349_c0_g1~~TRINITY_DN72349_c0_g1_i1.p1  ORF type:complete len:182 (-),score=14.80 TRINITY_DN72349_c0_g1_i1:49-516(-)